MRTFISNILFFFTLLLPAQVTVEARLDTADILIGEQVQLKATVAANAGAKVRFPQFENGYIVEGVEVINKSRTDTVWQQAGKRMQLTQRYTITAFDSALYYLPALEVEVDGKKYLSAGNIGLKVSTVPVDTVHPDEFPGPHGAVAGVFQWDGRLLWLSLLLWGILIGIFALLVRLSDKKPTTKRVVIKPPTPPHKKALEAIGRMNKPDAENREAVKAYYVELTEVLRTYIGERYGFSAREMTSGEILHHLQQNATEAVIYELREIFSTADLVKFAKQSATLGETERSLLKAANFVNTTQPAPQDLPKPIVKEVPLSQRHQIRVRWCLVAVTAILVLLETALAAYLCCETYDTFL